MKRVIFLVLCGCSGFQCSAQSWFPPEAEWHYTSWIAGTAGLGHIHMTVGIDTVINERDCTELRFIHGFGGVNPITGFGYTALPSMYVAFDDTTVWLLNSETLTFDTLFNMAANPGEHWGFPSLPEWMDCADPLDRYTVLDTGRMTLQGIELKWQAVELRYLFAIDPIEFITISDTIIERMGAIRSYLYPQDFCRSFFDANIGGPLRCYSDAEVDYSHQDPWLPWSGLVCAFVPNGIEDSGPVAFSLSPNPSNGLLRIDMGASVPTASTLSVFNARGQLAATRSLRDPITTLDLADLPAGPYLIQIRTGAVTHAQVWLKDQ